MINLFNNDTGAPIGILTENQLQYLIDELEEEDSTDQTYWLNREQIDWFKEDRADAALIALLEKAMGIADDIEIRWARD